jgi:hypothetical protein
MEKKVRKPYFRPLLVPVPVLEVEALPQPPSLDTVRLYWTTGTFSFPEKGNKCCSTVQITILKG